MSNTNIHNCLYRNAWFLNRFAFGGFRTHVACNPCLCERLRRHTFKWPFILIRTWVHNYRRSVDCCSLIYLYGSLAAEMRIKSWLSSTPHKPPYFKVLMLFCVFHSVCHPGDFNFYQKPKHFSSASCRSIHKNHQKINALVSSFILTCVSWNV